ncbi:MAG: hypothetical protein IJY55_03245 [Clostridia bacterium]|nr:hypothetical protein [Clostridia bacterium]
MKNIISKTFCLILALCLALSFAGCGNNAKDAQEAKTTVTAFMDAVVNLDMNEATKYVDDQAVIDSLELGDISGLAIDTAIQQNPEMAQYKEKFVPIVDKAIEKAKEVCSYEIIAEEKESSGFVYTINLTTPNDSTAAEEQLKKAMEEYTTQDGLMKLMGELLSSGKVTLSSSQDEIINATFDVLLDKIINALDNITFETKTEEINVTVSKTGDKWLVNTAELSKE